MAGRLVADLYLGALGWVDISERVRQPVADSGGGITIIRERPEGRQVADPGQAALVIDNDGGDFSPRNPRSPYFGILGRNTPIRGGIRLVADDFDRTVSNSWGTTTTGQVWSNYFSPTSAYAVSAGLATQSHSAVNQLRAARLNTSLLDAEQVSNIQVPAAVTGAAAVAGHQYRAQSDGSYYWARLEFNAGASVTGLYDWDTDAEGWAGEGSTSVQRVTSETHDGAGSLEATQTMGSGFSELRFNDGVGLRDLSGDGPTLSAWVLIPADAGGTGWQARLELQDPGFSWMSGPNFDVVPGEWTLITYTPDPALLANCRAMGFAIGATGVNASQSVYVDTVAQFGTGTTTLKISRSDAGALTTLAEIVDVPGLPYTAGQPLTLRSSVVGRRLSLMAWDPADPGSEPADWMLTWVDDSEDAILTPGLLGIETWLVSGNSNSLPFAFAFGSYGVIDRRLWMEVPTWPTRWNVAGTDVWAPIEAAGILRRLGQGERPVLSALTRFLGTTEADLVAAWPMTDGEDATVAAPLLPTGQPLAVRAGVMDFVPEEGPPGAGGAAHPDPTAVNALTGVIVGASATSWQVSIWSKGQVATEPPPGDPEADPAYYVAWEIVTTAGQVVRLAFQTQSDEAIGVGQWTSLSSTTPANIVALDDDPDTNGAGHRLNPGITGEWIHVQFYIEQNGADANAFLYVNGESVDAQVWSGLTIGAPRDITTPSAFGAGNAPSLNVAEFWLTGLAIHNGGFLVAEQYEAGLGYPGELAVDRLERESAIEGVPIAVVRGPDDSPPMGPQWPATYLDIVKDCADVDQGVLTETRERVGLAYLCGSALLNQPDAVTLDYAAGQLAPPLEPVDDDLDVANDITVKRTNGSSTRAIAETGRMSVLPPEDGGIGRYAVEATVNVATDQQTADQAWWRLRISTWDEARYPRIAVNLAAPDVDQDLTAAAVALDDGGIVALTGLPDWLPPGPTRAMVRGGVEYIGDDAVDGLQRSIAWSAAPAGPYDVATADGDPPAPADGSTLVADIAATDTELLLGSTVENGPWWVGDASTQPDDYPMPVRVGGELVTVSEIEPSVVDTFGGTSSSGWPAANTGQAWSHPVGSGTDYTEGSGKGQILMSVVNTLYSSVLDVGSPYAQYTVDLSLNVSNAPGAAVTLWVCAGWQGTNDHNFARLTLSTGGIMSLGLLRRNGGSLTTVTSSITGTANTSGDVWRVTWRSDSELLYATMQNITTGAQPVAIRGPATDGATGTGIAILARRESGSTGGTITATVDNLTVNSPQLVTLTSRGVNGISRAWAAGTPIDVAEPAIAAL